MCEGRTVKLACGHNLIHYKSRCKKNCEIPEGEILSIHDSCSACHIKPNLIKQHYEQLQLEAQKEYLLAHREGRFDDLRKISRLMEERRAAEFREFGDARRKGKAYVQVVWPGCQEEQQYVSQNFQEDWSFLPTSAP